MSLSQQPWHFSSTALHSLSMKQTYTEQHTMYNFLEQNRVRVRYTSQDIYLLLNLHQQQLASYSVYQ
jgi:hypothetical protein